VHRFGRDDGERIVVVAGSGAPADPAADADRLAQSTARNALVAVLTASTDHASFSDVTLRELRLIEPSLSFTSGPSTGPLLVSVVTTSSAAGIAVRSEVGTCFWIRSSTVMSNTYGEGEPCTGDAALGASASSWS
jgi:hypothetical protein